MVNQESQKDSRTKDLERIMKFGRVNASQGLGSNKKKYFDATLEQSGPSGAGRRDKRKQSAFNFVAEGTFVKRGEIMRRQKIAQELAHDPMSSFGLQIGASK